MAVDETRVGKLDPTHERLYRIVKVVHTRSRITMESCYRAITHRANSSPFPNPHCRPLTRRYSTWNGSLDTVWIVLVSTNTTSNGKAMMTSTTLGSHKAISLTCLSSPTVGNLPSATARSSHRSRAVLVVSAANVTADRIVTFDFSSRPIFGGR